MLPHSFPVSNLVFHEDLSLNELLDSFPGRRPQILELINLLGPMDSPLFPLFVYGGASTGKTSTILQIFKHLKRPFIYVSLITSYSPRLLFESILNQLSSHGASENHRGKRCETPSDFVNLLREALSDLVNTLKGNLGKNGSNKVASVVNGRMVYLIFDRFEVARDWDKGSATVPLMFNLYDILKMPEVGLIFLSRASLETFYTDTGYSEPFSVHFPDYDEADLRSIFMRSQSGSKLYSTFLDLVLRPFCRITRRVDELSLVFSPLFKKYCEPLSDLGTNLSEEIKRSLFKHIQPHMTLFMQTTFISSSPSLFDNTSRNKKKVQMKHGNCESGSGEVDFHMSISAKYLLISAFLASRNPATLDASLFDSTGGLNNHKRKRKASEKSLEQKETKEQELLMKGPGTFPLERLLAIYQCITSALENDETEDNDGSGAELMTSILFQLSSLCSANFVTKGRSSCPLEGSARYRCTVSEDMVLKVARSVKFPLSKYLYRR